MLGGCGSLPIIPVLQRESEIEVPSTAGLLNQLDHQALDSAEKLRVSVPGGKQLQKTLTIHFLSSTCAHVQVHLDAHLHSHTYEHSHTWTHAPHIHIHAKK